MRHIQHGVVLAAAAATVAAAAGVQQQQQQQQQRQPGFSIHQDLLAYPQFEVVISEAYILEPEAQALLDKAEVHSSRRAATRGGSGGSDSHATDLAPGSGSRGSGHDDGNDNDETDEDSVTETYEIMSAPPHRYLCAIPVIEAPVAPNKTATELAKAEEAKELARASAHGWDLVNGLEGSCLHYVLGWWSYTFCYGQSVVQFHALPGSMKIGPPVRDPQTMEYVLGRQQINGEVGEPATAAAATTNTPSQQSTNMELQVKGDQRYMVQRLDAGTICDLTGRERTIEIQYHCSPGSTQDRIGWIKEVTTCAYLMVVHTPRLCDDVAFLPPKETKANIITCRDIIPVEGIDEWRQKKMVEVEDMLVGKGRGGGASGNGKGPVTIGGIVVGGRKTFGDEVARLSPPRGARQHVDAVQQVLELVARGSGKEKSFETLTDEEMARLGIDPETIEKLREEMKKVAGEKEWKIELIEVGGEDDARALRAVVMEDADESEGEAKGGQRKEQDQGDDKEDEGSQEQFYERERDEL
ncbi:glucosidase II beta subunit-like protein-domain-containing protein [Microdochium trichocladiopsis]|uniref:Endoplasmic reticulum lectin n=1 Tax=Microdochium trichocladiopsis TaxID=1682393 RepID=A0A9P8XVJ9_9PEZI|nr:glucosidase II beta subunit-like protein-domain-containing protein [Microdochium trichocladiopsis]KAH7021316.1 glucosidase II beta subunit-like protein-domain-containing protein [Microdochium trichocladiopsis]